MHGRRRCRAGRRARRARRRGGPDGRGARRAGAPPRARGAGRGHVHRRHRRAVGAASATLAGAVGGLRDLPQRARRGPRPARRAAPPPARGLRRDRRRRRASRSTRWPPGWTPRCARSATSSTACDATHRAVFTALVPLADRARAALATARELDPDGADTVRLAGALADVERALVHDPLALADRPVEDVLAPLAARARTRGGAVRGARRRSRRVDGRARRAGDGARRGRGRCATRPTGPDGGPRS